MDDHDSKILKILAQSKVVALRNKAGTLATFGPDPEQTGLLIFKDMATAMRFCKMTFGSCRDWRPFYMKRTQLLHVLPRYDNAICTLFGDNMMGVAKLANVVRPSTHQTYDVPMIRDFLEHLEWHLVCSEQELRQVAGNHHELAGCESDTVKINPELTEQLGKYIDRRRRVLLFGRCIDRQDCTNEEVAKALGEFANIWAEKRSKQLEALRSLRSCFQEALKAAEIELDATKGIPLIPFTANDLFEDEDSSQPN